MFSKKLVNDSSGVIALLFRRMIKKNNLIRVLESLIGKYVDNNFVTTADRTTERTNLLATIKSGRMTIKMFIELFIKLFEVKHLSFKIETKFNGKIYTSEHIVDIKNKEVDVSYFLFQGLLENGLQEHLKKSIDINVASKKERAGHVVIAKIKNIKMTWKTLVEILSTIFRADYITIICKVEYGNRRLTAMEESATINI